MVIWVQNDHTELMLEIYSKRLERAVGKVLLMKFRYNTISINVTRKQSAVLVVQINDIGQEQ